MLKAKIDADFKKALLEREEGKLSTLRMLKNSIFNREKEKRYNLSKEKPEFSEEELEKESYLNDEEVLGVISSEIKKRKEAIVLFEKGKRDDLVKKEAAEVEILIKYLPEQMSEEELRKTVKEIIEKTGAKSQKEMGRVMAQLMPKVKGKADGSLVSKVVKELLS